MNISDNLIKDLFPKVLIARDSPTWYELPDNPSFLLDSHIYHMYIWHLHVHIEYVFSNKVEYHYETEKIGASTINNVFVPIAIMKLV